MYLDLLDRKSILDQAKDEDELSNLKRFADGMLRDFEKFNDASSNRAIWELVQNACDLTKECKVNVEYNCDGLSFTHNGNPFTTKSLISLIKQVSGKYGDSNDLPEVGKYGTGFLTTHTFGRVFVIDSYLEANSTYFKISNFRVDRTPKEWMELSDNIRTQKDEVFRIIREEESISKPEKFETKFTYHPGTEQELKYISNSRKSLVEYVPLVLTINDRLKEFTIVDPVNGNSKFSRASKEPYINDKDIPLYKTVILHDDKERLFFSLVDEEDEIEIILPINENLEVYEFGSQVARLFLHFPLIGSEKFGFNFIVNCKKFLPTEPRNGIHIKSDKDQLQEQEKENRRLLSKVNDMIFNFLKSEVLEISSPLYFSKINFERNSDNTLLNTYFSELQEYWIEEFKSFAFVTTIGGKKAIGESRFFDKELIESEDVFKEIYQLTSMFFDNIPVEADIKTWSIYASEWQNETISFVTNEDIVKQIAGKELSNFDEQILIRYYGYLIDKGYLSLFSENNILPNINGKFQAFNHILKPISITGKLTDIGKVVISDTMSRFIHPDFEFKFIFDQFNRKDFTNKVKEALDEKISSGAIYLDESFVNDDFVVDFDEKIQKLDKAFFEGLLQYCKLSPTLSSQSKPVQLVQAICEYYGEEKELILLENLEEKEENLDVRYARKTLAQIFFNLLANKSDKWVQNNLDLLMTVCSSKEDSIKEAYNSAKIYPNQLNQLCEITNLKRDIDLTDEITTLYDKVHNSTIKSKLIWREFNEFVAEDQLLTNKKLCTEIEDTFFNSDINKINEHPYKEDILSIISKLRNPFYSNLFQRLDDKKANLMLDVVTNENTKDDIFSIVTLKEHQLKSLGKLIQNENFEKILETAKVVLQQETEKRADFEHKYKIGTYIEKLIRLKVGEELRERVSVQNELNAEDEQGGQDIVIYLDELVLYRIEVKSRWNSQNSVTMSKKQLERAVTDSNSYALCVVDITKYEGEGNRYELTIEDVLPLTKFVSGIGEQVGPLIEENIRAEKSVEEKPHLVDFRGVIPQPLIRTGSEFDEFLSDLVARINAVEMEVIAG